MSIAKTYNPKEAEDKWYSYWMNNGFFRSTPDEREPYTIVMPPPNVTGVLHMGHMLNNTIQDVLIRRARMQGKNACWVPGTDHASIATEAKVVAMLKEQGIDKKSISREDFLKYAWEWKEKYGRQSSEAAGKTRRINVIGNALNSTNESGIFPSDYNKEVSDSFEARSPALGRIFRRELNRKDWDQIIHAYRPQTAVDNFKEWALIIEDTLAKQEFYPDTDKRDLFKSGYIAENQDIAEG
ncbi:hypothetical protein FQR65_LT17395 [Abscondita terminalis]|nr:hypothetical protein FQR65_LT17395 [Abscondita terminalis]